jgi:hypothetical protein
LLSCFLFPNLEKKPPFSGFCTGIFVSTGIFTAGMTGAAGTTGATGEAAGTPGVLFIAGAPCAKTAPQYIHETAPSLAGIPHFGHIIWLNLPEKYQTYYIILFILYFRIPLKSRRNGGCNKKEILIEIGRIKRKILNLNYLL